MPLKRYNKNKPHKKASLFLNNTSSLIVKLGKYYIVRFLIITPFLLF